MNRHRFWMRLALVATALGIVSWAGDVGLAQAKKKIVNLQTTITDVAGRKHTRMRKVTQAEKKAAAASLKGKIVDGAAAAGVTAAEMLAMAPIDPPAADPDNSGGLTGEYLVGPNGQLVPDVSGLVPNYAYSPMPDFEDAACALLDNKCGIRKFVDGLPGLGPTAANNLGQYIPVAVPDTTRYPGSDYYEIELGQYTEKMHSDLPPTTLRGYRQTNITPVPPFHYLGPLIVAQKGRPVRITFTNNLPVGADGDLFIPVDTTVMGAGAGPRVGDATRMTTDGQLCSGGVKADCYTQNRATIHLHGGVTPWISDGTTHQWITPAGEATSYPKGVSVYNVPDMPNPGKPGVADPGPGVQTFYYTNDQSARLMFYHDHAHGITRLNVYAGEAAGYLLTDATEQALMSAGDPANGVPAGPLAGVGYGIPLIIQDKTFVDARTIGWQDPTWNWGTGPASLYADPTGKTTMVKAPVTGDLWWPHVYQPAENPYDISGFNAMGRWVYGPWFWPPTNSIAFKEVPNPYYDCDMYGNPIPPATSCRDWQPLTNPGTPNPSVTAEAFFDTPVVNGTAYPYVNVPAGPVRFRILNAAHDRFWNLSLYVADEAGNKNNGFATEVKLNPTEVLAAKDDAAGVFPTPDAEKLFDSEIATPGPDWIYIGTEGGFLPMPVIVPPQPTTWVVDPTLFTAGLVDKHSLLLGPAERADVIVDFSAFAGKTIILYNDAPAAFPARVPQYDFYTDSADLTDTGGVAPVLPGYGPNTRTVMQIRVDSTPQPAFDIGALMAAFAPPDAPGTGVFPTGQDPVIVGQTAYNEAYGKTFPARYPCWGVSRIQDTSMCVQPVTGQGPLYLPIQPKAIHDEMGASFDDYGRMSTNLGLELPFTQVGNQNFILQSYSDPPTELVKLSATAAPLGDPLEDGTQIWKVTHNGVDTHPVHFHLFHVQLINRVGWDGMIKLPHPTELGWKDTVRISPLEDTIVALRPIAPTPDSLPWPLPNSVRPLEPALPIGSTLGFTGLDPLGNAVTVTNEPTNFGWEYIWHCHILSHEEHDMMRAIGFAVPPNAPAAFTAVQSGKRIVLTWTNSSPEITTGFRIQRSTSADFTTGLATFNVGTMTSFTDTSASTSGTYVYRIFAANTIGSTVPGYPTMTRESAPTIAFYGSAPAAPTNLRPTVLSQSSLRLNWTDASTNEAGFRIERALVINGVPGAFTPLGGTLAANSTAFTDSTVSINQTYAYRVSAVNAVGSNTAQVLATVGTPAAPTSALGQLVTGTRQIRVTWTDNSNNESGFTIQRATNAAFTAGLTTATVGANVTTYQTGNLSRGVTYYFRVTATNTLGSSAPATTAGVLVP